MGLSNEICRMIVQIAHHIVLLSSESPFIVWALFGTCFSGVCMLCSQYMQPIRTSQPRNMLQWEGKILGEGKSFIHQSLLYEIWQCSVREIPGLRKSASFLSIESYTLRYFSSSRPKLPRLQLLIDTCYLTDVHQHSSPIKQGSRVYAWYLDRNQPPPSRRAALDRTYQPFYRRKCWNLFLNITATTYQNIMWSVKINIPIIQWSTVQIRKYSDVGISSVHGWWEVR